MGIATVVVDLAAFLRFDRADRADRADRPENPIGDASPWWIPRQDRALLDVVAPARRFEAVSATRRGTPWVSREWLGSGR
jgi:hypothetical protein